MKPLSSIRLVLAAWILACLLPGCQSAPATICRLVGTDVTGTWQVTFANQAPQVTWTLSQCDTDVRGSERRKMDTIGIQGSLGGTKVHLARSPRSRADVFSYDGQLGADGRIRGTYSSTQEPTAFTAERIG